jgi:hypothetical protein
MITNQANDLLYLWNDCDPGPEPAQAQLGDVNAIDGYRAASCLDNPYQVHKSGLCAAYVWSATDSIPDLLFQIHHAFGIRKFFLNILNSAQCPSWIFIFHYSHTNESGFKAKKDTKP